MVHARDRQLVRPRRHAAHDAHRPIQGRQLRLRSTSGSSAPRRRASRAGIEAAHGKGLADAGAFVAMDPRDGEVLALGSYPSFDANLFAKPITRRPTRSSTARKRRAAVQPRDRRRLSDRLDVQADHRARGAWTRDHHAEHAAQRTPACSATAAREFKNAREPFRHAGAAARAAGLLRRLLLPARRRRQRARPGHPVVGAQAQLRPADGIDLPGEYGGLVPDAKWRNSGTSVPQCAKKGRSPTGTTEALYACGGIERGWSGGDNVNLAVGQGDLQATPLQLATAYAAIATAAGSSRRTPARQIEDGAGAKPEEIRKPHQACGVDISHDVEVILGGLQKPRGAAGRLADVFAASPTLFTAGPAPRGARRTPTSPVRCYVDDPVKADRRRADDREGRLRGRGRGPRARHDPR